MSEDQDKKDSFILPIGLIIVVLILWLVTLWLVFKYLPDWPTRGQFRDPFGSINALFTGLAFAGIVYTIYIQRKELALQRVELKLQREEMTASRAELKAQVNAQTATNRASIGQMQSAVKQAHIELFPIKIVDR